MTSNMYYYKVHIRTSLAKGLSNHLMYSKGKNETSHKPTVCTESSQYVPGTFQYVLNKTFLGKGN